MRLVSRELALGMALALESSEQEIDSVLELLRDPRDPAIVHQLALQLLLRARRRIGTVRLALADNPASTQDP
jgi:hypothetical protein